ncbi:MAG: tyrosine-type recombinase/integrase, partial [Ruminiclostridium sp.]
MRKGDIKQGRVLTKKVGESITFEQLVEEYVRQGEIKNMSEYTIKSYRHHTGYFSNFIGKDFKCKDITLVLIENYILYMKKEKQIINPVTLNSYIRNISPIIKYGIMKKEILQDFLMPSVKEQETFKEIYTGDELNKLLQKPKKTDFVALRTYTIIWTFASTGIRARELRELRVNNVNLINRIITVNQTKNKKARHLP